MQYNASQNDSESGPLNFFFSNVGNFKLRLWRLKLKRIILEISDSEVNLLVKITAVLLRKVLKGDHVTPICGEAPMYLSKHESKGHLLGLAVGKI